MSLSWPEPRRAGGGRVRPVVHCSTRSTKEALWHTSTSYDRVACSVVPLLFCRTQGASAGLRGLNENLPERYCVLQQQSLSFCNCHSQRSSRLAVKCHAYPRALSWRAPSRSQAFRGGGGHSAHRRQKSKYKAGTSCTWHLLNLDSGTS